MRGKDLKVRRVKAGLKQYRVAAALDIPPALLSFYENERRPLPPGMDKRILEAINDLRRKRKSARHADRRLQGAGREETPGPNDGEAVEPAEHTDLTTSGSDHGRGALRHGMER